MQGYRWNLVIAGPDEQGTKKQLCARMHRLGLCFRDMTETEHDEATTSADEPAVDIRLLDAVHGEGKWELLRRADVLLYPVKVKTSELLLGRRLPVMCPWL